MTTLARVVAPIVLLCSVGCERTQDAPERERPTRTARDEEPSATPTVANEPSPRTLYLPDDEEPPLPRPRACPEDMVFVPPRLCVDRYEFHLVDESTRSPLSPFFTPSAPSTLREHSAFFHRLAEHGGRGRLAMQAVPEPSELQLLGSVTPRAVSAPGVLPQGYLSKHHASRACEQAGKRLCSRFEWVLACGGQGRTAFPYGERYEEGACNVHRNSHPAVLLHGNASLHHRDPRLLATYDSEGPLLRRTGATTRCGSRWGDDVIYDMVGNIDEWVSDEDGAFLGGFFSRGTKAGCLASIDVHGPEYLDYSLGGRCCRDVLK